MFENLKAYLKGSAELKKKFLEGVVKTVQENRYKKAKAIVEKHEAEAK